MPTYKTWKQRSCRAWNPISRVSPRLGLKGQLSLSTGCRFTKFSKRRRRNWWILSSWAHTAVPASNTCSWAAWQKKSYVWRHAQCSSRASLPLCQYHKGRSVMTFTHVLVPTDFSEPATQAFCCQFLATMTEQELTPGGQGRDRGACQR